MLNNKNYQESMDKSESAANNYNEGLSKLYILKDNFTSDVNDGNTASTVSGGKHGVWAREARGRFEGPQRYAH